MSWTKLDDGFEDHPKVEPLSDAAHRLWSRAACWSRKRENLHAKGFLPRALLCTIAKNKLPRAKLEKLAQELVEARGGGIFEHGLWEPRENGWQIHDWHVYGPPKGSEQQTAEERSEAARKAGQASAAARKAATGTAQPPNGIRTTPNDAESVRSDVRPNDNRTALERAEPPDPVPDPVPGSLAAADPSLSGHGPEQPPTAAAAREPEIPCPADLRLTPAQLATAGTCLIPQEVVDSVTRAFVMAEAADQGKRMTLTQWQKCLAKAVSRGSNDRPLRGPRLAAVPAPRQTNDGYSPAAHATEVK